MFDSCEIIKPSYISKELIFYQFYLKWNVCNQTKASLKDFIETLVQSNKEYTRSDFAPFA